MLAIDGMPHYDTRVNRQTKGMLPVIWIDIDDPSKETVYGANALYTYQQGQGAAPPSRAAKARGYSRSRWSSITRSRCKGEVRRAK